jgi:hypothetical protein
MAIISIRSCHGPAPNGERRIVATKFAVISPKCRSRLATSVQVFGRRHDDPSTRCGGRRPKSAKARSRGKLGTGGAAGAMGI